MSSTPRDEMPETATSVIDYRTPGTSMPRLQRVMSELVVSEQLGAAAVVTKVAIGLPLALIGPAIFTLIILSGYTRARRGEDAAHPPSFLLVMVIVTAVVLPLLMWFERRSRGEFFSDGVRGEPSPSQASSYGEYEMLSTRMSLLAYVELALTGPRLLWEAIDSMRGRTVGNAELRAAAAELVCELLDAGEGRQITQLVRPGRSAAHVQYVAKYLLRMEWVGMSSKRDRVWLASNVRERLVRF